MSLNYRQSGVNISAGKQLADHIQVVAKQTHRPEVKSSIGGFSGLFALPEGYKQPLLVSCTDGVGTKLKIATAMNRHETIGIDLVAMCVNDVIVCGAQPLFFLDYLATSRLELRIAQTIVDGIVQGCKMAGCALIGGETAEMPGMYTGKEYDLAGFSVGMVEQADLIDGRDIVPSDVLLGIASSGLHANGFSLVRKILSITNTGLHTEFEGQKLGDHLLIPTKIYVTAIQTLLKKVTLKGLAHITGGGLTDNIPRMLPESVQAVIQLENWTLPPIMQWLQTEGQLQLTDLLQTFNCGMGMVLCVAKTEAKTVIQTLEGLGETVSTLGYIQTRTDITQPPIQFI